ncbi:MAG: hypothetical protein IKN38_03605 [Clostridia bacterium]|nr:hypothetical protein [Clostridia bacterium]
MKKTSLFLAVLFVFLALFASSCGDDDGYENFKYEDGAIVSEETGHRFIAAPIGFQPCGMGEKCAVKDGAFDLYTMTDLDGKPVSVDEWMSGEYSGAATTVYYREGLEIPAFDRIDYSKCFICQEDENVVSFATIEDKTLIGKLVSAAALGEMKTLIDEPSSVYTLKFYSEDYPMLLYSVDYLVYEGASYLFVRENKTYADVTGLIDRFIPSDDGAN